jgi:hypothetical protein
MRLVAELFPFKDCYVKRINTKNNLSCNIGKTAVATGILRASFHKDPFKNGMAM